MIDPVQDERTVGGRDQLDADAGERVIRSTGCAQQHLAAHSEVDDQRLGRWHCRKRRRYIRFRPRTRRIEPFRRDVLRFRQRQGQPEELAPTDGGGEGAPDEPVGEVLARARMPTQGALVENGDG